MPLVATTPTGYIQMARRAIRHDVPGHDCEEIIVSRFHGRDIISNHPWILLPQIEGKHLDATQLPSFLFHGECKSCGISYLRGLLPTSLGLKRTCKEIAAAKYWLLQDLHPAGLSPVWFLGKTDKPYDARCTSRHAGHSGLSPVWFEENRQPCDAGCTSQLAGYSGLAPVRFKEEPTTIVFCWRCFACFACCCCRCFSTVLHILCIFSPSDSSWLARYSPQVSCTACLLR